MSSLLMNANPFKPSDRDISPEVFLLHAQINSWSEFEFAHAWGQRFKANWKTLTPRTIEENTGITFVTRQDKTLLRCDPNLTNNQNGKRVPWKGMCAKTEAESRARFIYFMATVLPLIN